MNVHSPPPQLPLSPPGSRVGRPPAQSLHVPPPAPERPAARQLRPRRRAPPPPRWRGVSLRLRRTRQGAAGGRSPPQRKGGRERRARVSQHGPTKTLTTATTIRSSSRQRGSEVRDRGTLNKMTLLFLLLH